jgi:agmatinase
LTISPDSRSVTILGLPFDGNSSFLRGAALAPPLIRQALHSLSSNLFTENGLDLGAPGHLVDAGDLESSDEPGPLAPIQQAVAELLEQDALVLSLGGDHSVTYPILQAYGKKYRDLAVLHLDAHPDLYDELDGNRYSHGSPFARVMEEGLVGRLIQVGIRAPNTHQREQIARYGVEVFELRHGTAAPELAIDGPLYLSLDLDVLDPGFAPGIAHHEPGGLSPRDVIQIIQNIRTPLVGADIVEFNPTRDPLGVTAMVAAKFLKEIAGRILELA